MISVLLVGCGRFGGFYNPMGLNTYSGAILSSKSLNLVGCIDNNISRASHLADVHSCPYFENLTSASEYVDPDVIIISNKSESHLDTLLEAKHIADFAKIILVEKPICTKLEDWSSVKIRSKYFDNVYINHSRRLEPFFQNLRSQISEKKIGAPLYLHGIYYGGWLLNGTHLVDLIDFLFDDQILWSNKFFNQAARHEFDECFDITGTLQSTGAKVFLNCVNEKFYQAFDLDIFFESARVQIRNFGEEISIHEVATNDNGERVLKKQQKSIEKLSTGPLNVIQEIESFIDGRQSFLFDVKLETLVRSVSCTWAAMEMDTFKK